MDLRKLRHATTLAAECNFARAASKLHITQSALSQSISRLEQETGLNLFDRDRSGVSITAAGQAFVARAHELLQHSKGFEHDMALLRDGQTGSVSFGIGPLPAVGFLPDLLARVIRERPGLNVQVEINNGADLFEHLLAERIEFFIADSRHFGADRSIKVRPLVRLRLAVYGRAGHPAASRPNLKAADLRAYPMLSVKSPLSYEQQQRQLLGLGPAEALPNYVVCDDFFVLKKLAATTDALMIASPQAVAEECAAGTLVELALRKQRLGEANIVAVSLAHRSLSPAAAMLIEQFLDAGAGGALKETPGRPKFS